MDRINPDVTGEIARQVSAVIDGMTKEIGLKNSEDRKKSEIIMYNDVGFVLTALRQSVFHEMAGSIGHQAECWYKNVDRGVYSAIDELARMCTVFNEHPTEDSYTSDIFIRRSVFKDKVLSIPPVNTGSFCPDGIQGDFSAFAVMVHEIGHVLGIGGGSPGPIESAAGHPGSKIKATVMVAGVAEETCGVFPLDKMAIMALYQTIVGAP